jgi:hypothetical protein
MRCIRFSSEKTGVTTPPPTRMEGQATVVQMRGWPAVVPRPRDDGKAEGSGFGRILEHPICYFGWKAREYPDPMVGVASLVDRTACGFVGDVDRYPVSILARFR